MKAEQVVITSTGSSQEGHQLLARSENIEDSLIKQICLKCPNRNSLEYGQRESTCYFPVGQDKFVFGRSVVGPANGDMQRQILTYLIVVERLFFKRFDYHAPNLIHSLRSTGQLIFMADPTPILPAIELPERVMNGLLGHTVADSDSIKVQDRIRLHQQVGLMGVKRPLDLLARVFDQTELQQRADLSFAICRRANESSQFKIYVHKSNDDSLGKEFSSHQILPIDMRPKAVATAP